MAVLGLLLALCGAALVSAPRAVQALAQSRSVPLPIVMYHSVTDEGESPGQYVVPMQRFEEDLQYLKQNGYQTVTARQVLDYVQNGAPLPEKPVMLTFDDGFYNNYSNVWPALKQHGMVAVLSPLGQQAELFTNAAEEKKSEVWSYCTGAELREMEESGVMEIAHHSYQFHALHPRKGCLPMPGESAETHRRVFTEDTEKVLKLLAEWGITKPVCYTYPYGAANDTTEQLTEEMGFSVTMGCEQGMNVVRQGDSACLRRMKRWNRDGRTPTKQFWAEVLENTE